MSRIASTTHTPEQENALMTFLNNPKVAALAGALFAVEQNLPLSSRPFTKPLSTLFGLFLQVPIYGGMAFLFSYAIPREFKPIVPLLFGGGVVVSKTSQLKGFFPKN